MATTSRRAKQRRKFFTVQEANAALPLVRAIVRDVTALAHDLRERYGRLVRLQSQGTIDLAHEEELRCLVEDFERDQERMHEYEAELRDLHVELKDHYIGLVDFPAWMNGREVYLCWKLDEPAVSHWHELDAGFAGRKPLPQTE
ncbi:MAG: DUF2203 domain-containing protein [Gemmataceae bacterium]|nr:DUF2203 domain-containing protein [Gemmataceae bacterium]